MPSADPSLVLTFEDARHLVEEHAKRLRPKGRELLALLDASGRVLAEPIHADRDFPPFPRATRDGYALRTVDVQNVPAQLEVVAEVRAGSALEGVPPLQPGQAIAIMTGAPVPSGADAVLMIEHSSRSQNRIEVKRSITAGENVVPARAEGRRGDVLLPSGTRLDYACIAVAAAVGRSRVVVYAKPKVAVLSTGDEISSPERRFSLGSRSCLVVFPAVETPRLKNPTKCRASISLAFRGIQCRPW